MVALVLAAASSLFALHALAEQRTISMVGPEGPQFYRPPDRNINPEDTVVWQNGDGEAHTATAGNGSFDTGNVPPGGTSRVIGPLAPGRYEYACKIHPEMTGEITVNEAPEPEPTLSPLPPPPPDATAAPGPAEETSPPPPPSPTSSPTPSPTRSSPTPSPTESPRAAAAEEGGLPVPLLIGLLAILVVGGAGAGIWWLRRSRSGP